VSTAYSYDLNDRLTSQGGTTYRYDNNGNTLTETLDAKVKTYSYDAKNKLIGVSTTESDIEVSSSAYSYNVNGIRDSKTEDGVTTSYVVDSNRDYAQVLEEVVDGLSTVTYSYGNDLVSQNREEDFRFYQYDGLGSTRALANSAGVLTDTYDYEAFGEVLNETGTTDNNYKFTGEQFDSSLDQYYLRARYYDQSVGRFTQQDTYMGNNFDPVSLHKYLYANAAPSMYTDPTGNFSIGGMMSTLNTMSRLSNLAQTSVSVFKIATGEEKFDAKAFGTAIIFNMLGNRAGKFLGLLGQKLSKSCNSFTGDTLVSTEYGLKPIAEIVIGDKVWAYNEETDDKSLQEVVHLIQREGDKEIIDITLMSGEVIQATDGHPFYANNANGEWNWMDAGDLVSGSILTNFSGDELKVSSVSQSQQYLSVFNITVDNDHTYFVGEGEVLNHNVNKGYRKKGLVFGVPKPVKEINTKHVTGERGYSPKAGTLPNDWDIAFDKSAVFDGVNWWAKGQGGALYRYSDNGHGVFHWSGSTKDIISPLTRKNKIPNDILKLFGLPSKGS
jgi:RHS repeat-associated protein